ncbi:MAG TPA: ankyrin repeat domain-containing protein [Pyrinomonadaceae bacterium]|nr:ankyrin repeat domain-containing protein [Pyrinomonadaceae bacterium]
MRDSLNKNVEGRTLLMHAAFEGDLDRVIRLLEEGSDPNASDAGGDTALMFAAMRGHFMIVKMLLAHGAAPLERAKNGWTPRRFAETGRHAEVVSLLERAEEKSYRDGLARLNEEFDDEAH